VGIRVSVVVPVFNGEAFVATAIASALAQTVRDIEVLVADNGSTDGTWALLKTLAQNDPRVRPLKAPEGRGPDVARNACLDVAQGEWIAVLDADDSMHPERLERLLAFAAARGADLVADNQRLVEPDGRLLRLAWPPGELPEQIDTVGFVARNLFGQRSFSLGYIKPLFRRRLVEAPRLRYPARPRIVEDYQFMYALLQRGSVLHILPEAYYDYVQMPGSLSRTFNADDLAALKAATLVHLETAGDDPRLGEALRQRLDSLDTGMAHAGFIGAVKRWRFDQAVKAVAARPQVLSFIFRFGTESLTKRLRRLVRRPALLRAGAPVVAYFGQDCTDNAVIRRVAAFRQAGMAVRGFTFRRHKFNRNFQPDWDNLALGETRDRDYRGRLTSLVRAAVLLWVERQRLSGVGIVYARNIDMALLALWARLVSGCKAPLVYEVLDVQRAFLGVGWGAKVLRWVERRILARSRLLVVSSPAFVREYFAPMQGFRGDWFLLENKVLAAQLPAVTVSPRRPAAWTGRWVIGWFGTLRCVESLRILAAIAEALPDQVVISLRGFPTETGLGPFLDVVERHPNMVYEGEFFSPRDLPSIYGVVDFAWGFDFLDSGSNSDWLLPNRLYDAGAFGVPLLALAGTQTGRVVEELGMGKTFSQPVAEAVISFLQGWTPALQAELRQRLQALPRSRFVEEDDTKRLVRTVLAIPIDQPVAMPAEAPPVAE